MRSVPFLVLLLLLTVRADADFGRYIAHEHAGSTLVITTDLGEVRLSAVDDAAIEVHYVEKQIRQLPSFALDGVVPEIPTAVSATERTITFMVDGLTAVVDKDPLRIGFLRDGEPLVEEEHGYFAYDTLRGFRFALDEGEKLLGGGQRVLGMDRRGHRMPLYNKAAYGYESGETPQMYYGLPAVMSSDKYIIVFDNSARGWLDIGSTESDVLAFEAVGGRTAYIVVAGRTYPELVRNYADTTGRQPLPPRWTLGNFASRFGYHSEAETRDVVARFKAANIPLDAVVLDIYWFGPDIKGHMGKLDWDRDAWPNPEAMIAEFAADGIKTLAVTEPFILSSSTRWQDAVDNDVLARTPTGEPRRFDFYFGNTGLIDIFDARARDWFWKPYEALFSQGIAGTWGDLGEPEVHPADALHRLTDAGVEATADEVHNAYGHAWAEMVYEAQRASFPDMRPMILMRSGFAGSQRYGMIPWTGDVKRSWGGLAPQVELALQMGLLGLGYTHSDLGGFADGEKFDRELYLRWLQYGVFQPLFRPHAQEHIAPEPVFHDRRTQAVARDFIRLRYRMLPYNYTLAWENATTGMPLMRPLFFEDESDTSLIDETRAYLWGDAFLVAPVLERGAKSVPVPLPRGTWFDFWSGRRYEGGATIDIPVSLETIPVLVRAGALVPMTDVVDSTDHYTGESLELHYYADASVADSNAQMFEDDGADPDSLRAGRFERLTFEARRDADALEIVVGREGDGYAGMPESRRVTIVIHNWRDAVDTLRVDGADVSYRRQQDELRIEFEWARPETVLRLNHYELPRADSKPVVYQVMTRLFGNRETNNEPWGTIEENGVGKFSDITERALRGIRELGTTHVWYTGVPHHALVRDYAAYGIDDDDPDVVKGRAGSPYAVKDYYSVSPDLADDPSRRLEEFRALVERTHAEGMNVIIDIVPNHVARHYRSVAKPPGVEDFGATDDVSVEWARDNDFYYVVGEPFRVPAGYVPLGGESHPLADGHFAESPARWTGNGARNAQPEIDDWFETAKVNFGIRPDGSYAFDRLPEEARHWSNERLADFWSRREIPASWTKFRDIAMFWLDQGVDGFRFDMAQLVPVEFWSYLNSAIKLRRPDALLMAEIYVPERFRDYLELGRMDYLYDKIDFYDATRAVIEGKAGVEMIREAHARTGDIESHMIRFLENHDEHRIASPAFAGDARKGLPGMAVSALMGTSATLLYFGQEVGEEGAGDAGFGDPSRTTIFDYWGVPSHQRWMNGGRFDGGALSAEERGLRDFHARLLRLSAENPALLGNYAALETGDDAVLAFARWHEGQHLLVIASFADEPRSLQIGIPPELITELGLGNDGYMLEDQLGEESGDWLVVANGAGYLGATLAPLAARAYVARQSPARDVDIVVEVPEGTPAIYLTGNLDALGPWRPDALLMTGDSRERRASLSLPAGHFLQYKVTLGSWAREAVDASGAVLQNFVLFPGDAREVRQVVEAFKADPRVYMSDAPGAGIVGSLVYWPDVGSRFLGPSRHVGIWLPPGYDDDPGRRYPVIYMSDGQNLFDPRIANTGIDWGVDEAIVRGMEEGHFGPAIVVAPWSTENRLREYSPWHDAGQYARFLIEELMPRVNSEFRTLTGPEHTFAMGSSMGGLLSWFLVREHPGTFGACGCLSSHFPLSEQIVASVEGRIDGDPDPTPYVLGNIEDGLVVPPDTRYFFDYGSLGLDALYGPTHAAVRGWLVASGLVEGQDFVVREYVGADHNEASWRARLGDQLDWLLGKSAPTD